jgi:hypothetical protein
VAKVRQLLVENQPEILGITHIPNGRVMAALRQQNGYQVQKNLKR